MKSFSGPGGETRWHDAWPVAVALAGVLFAAFLVHSFSFFDLGPSAPSRVSSPPASVISNHEIRIGVMTDLTGGYAYLTGGGLVSAVQMAIDDMGGQVAGAKVTLRIFDHRGNGALAREKALQWVNEGVDLIADVTGSPEALAVLADFPHERAVLMINSALSDAVLADCPKNTFQWNLDSHSGSRALATHLVRQGLKRWVVVGVNNVFGRDLARQLADAVREEGGDVLDTLFHERSQSQMFTPLRQAMMYRPQVIALANAGEDTVRAVRQAFDIREVSRDGVVLALPVGSPLDLQRIHPDLLREVYLAGTWWWKRTSSTQDFSWRYYPRHNEMPGDYQAGAYSSVIHYLRAVAVTGTDQPDVVAQSMRDRPVRDDVARGRVREDGRFLRDVYVMKAVQAVPRKRQPFRFTGDPHQVPMREAPDFAQRSSYFHPFEGKTTNEADEKIAREWDMVRIEARFSGEDVFRPLDSKECHFSKTKE